MWVDAPGHKASVVEIPNEPKPGPIVGGFFCLFPWLWAMGPTSSTVYVDLEPGVGPEDH